MDRTTYIVADGHKQAYDASIDQVQAEVEAKHAEELKTASVWKRMRIRRQIRKEIRARVKAIAPPDGLY